MQLEQWPDAASKPKVIGPGHQRNAGHGSLRLVYENHYSPSGVEIIKDKSKKIK